MFKQSGLYVSDNKSQIIAHSLNGALDNNEFFLEYQPIVDVYKKEIIGLEALLRWDNEQLGIVSPKDFIPIAEDTFQIIEIGAWVFESACKQWKTWMEHQLPSFYISINMSLIQFQDNQIVDMIKENLEKYKVPGNCIKIEITESTAMGNINDTLKKLQEIEQLGIEIFLDDFGTGYSSLSHLEMLPISTLKIDHSFICEINKNKRREMIIKAIVAMAKSLKLKVIAEGVETVEQYRHLCSLGCNVFQGYYFSKPVKNLQIYQLFNK